MRQLGGLNRQQENVNGHKGVFIGHFMLFGIISDCFLELRANKILQINAFY